MPVSQKYIDNLCNRLRGAEWIEGSHESPSGHAVLSYEFSPNKSVYLVIRPMIGQFTDTVKKIVVGERILALEIDHPMRGDSLAVFEDERAGFREVDRIDITERCSPARLLPVAEQYLRDFAEAYCCLIGEAEIEPDFS